MPPKKTVVSFCDIPTKTNSVTTFKYLILTFARFNNVKLICQNICDNVTIFDSFKLWVPLVQQCSIPGYIWTFNQENN